MRDRDAPVPDWRESSRDAIARLYPHANGAVVDLPLDAVEMTIELVALAEQAKVIDRRDREIRNMLRHWIGPASFGLLAKPVDVQLPNQPRVHKEVWRHAPNKSGVRTLLGLKKAPRHARYHGSNGDPVANDPLTAELEASLAK